MSPPPAGYSSPPPMSGKENVANNHWPPRNSDMSSASKGGKAAANLTPSWLLNAALLSRPADLTRYELPAYRVRWFPAA